MRRLPRRGPREGPARLLFLPCRGLPGRQGPRPRRRRLSHGLRALPSGARTSWEGRGPAPRGLPASGRAPDARMRGLSSRGPLPGDVDRLRRLPPRGLQRDRRSRSQGGRLSDRLRGLPRQRGRQLGGGVVRSRQFFALRGPTRPWTAPPAMPRHTTCRRTATDVMRPITMRPPIPTTGRRASRRTACPATARGRRAGRAPRSTTTNSSSSRGRIRPWTATPATPTDTTCRRTVTDVMRPITTRRPIPTTRPRASRRPATTAIFRRTRPGPRPSSSTISPSRPEGTPASAARTAISTSNFREFSCTGCHTDDQDGRIAS